MADAQFKFVAKRGPQYFAAVAANLGGFQFGLSNGWTSPAIPDIDDRKSFGGLTSDQESWLAALASLACLVAVYPAAFLIQRFGRKPVMIYISIPFTIGWLLMAFAQNYAMLLAGRFVTGFCGGTYCVAVPVFIAEMAEPNIRGALGSCYQLSIVSGILFVYVVGAFVSWNWLCIICIGPTIICISMLIFVPESPRYLIGKEDYDKAKKAFVWLRGANSAGDIEEEFTIVKENVEIHQDATFREVFTDTTVLKPISIGILLLIFQQLCGIDAVTFFTVSIFKDAGSTMDANLSTIIVGIVQVIFTIIAVLTVEKLGRRILLICSNLVLVVSLFTLGLFFFLQEDGEEVKLGWLPLVSLVVYISAFSLGIGPTAWLMVGEILPNHVIGIASSVATSFLWILSFLIVRFFEPVNEAVGIESTMWFFSACTLVSTVYVYFFLPETKGKTLDEVQEFFHGKKYVPKTKTKANNKQISTGTLI